MKKKYCNTIVIGFDDVNDVKRKELVETLSQGVMSDWVLFINADNILENKEVYIGDEFRHLATGLVVKIVEVAYSFENDNAFAVCDQVDGFKKGLEIRSLKELTDRLIWVKE